jgi:LPS-assembly protein
MPLRMSNGPKFHIYIFLLYLLTGGSLWSANFSKATWEIIPKGDGAWAYHPETNIATAHNGVIVKLKHPESNGASIEAERVTIDAETSDILAVGNVTLHRDGLVWRGDRLEYNYDTQRIGTGSYRAGKSPFIAAGRELAVDPETGNYRIGNAFISTDDYAEPLYKVETGSLELIDNERFVARNATVRVGRIPVFYLPYMRGNLKGGGNQFSTTPGYRSRYGAFLLNESSWQVKEHLTTTFHLDYRTRRGLGGGPDLDYQLGPVLGKGKLQTYLMDDREPGMDPRGQSITHDRYRIGWFHRANLGTDLTARVSVQKMSDPLLNRDFFESYHRQNTQPRSYLELSQQWKNYALSTLIQPQANTFFNRVERLPEVKLTGLRQQIGATPLFYESETSAGYYSRQFMYENMHNYDAARLDSFHQILYPKNYFGWLIFTPHAGARYGYYSATSGKGSTLAEQTRYVLNAGARLSTKLSRVYPAFESNVLDARGLRHIVTPSIDYVYVPEPNAPPTRLPQFDDEIPSLRMLPVDFPGFNAIDAIDARNVMRLGLRNQLQTKRGEHASVENLLRWHVFADWRLSRDHDQQGLADMTSDLLFRPKSWIDTGSMTRYSLEDNDLRLADQYVTLLPNNVWSFRIGHLYVRDEPTYWGIGNNVYYTRLYYRLNENWGARINHHYEARDGRLEEHSYTLYRDFRSFTGAFSLRMRNPRGNRDSDYTLAVVVSMKAFPSVKLGDDVNRPTRLFDSE